MKHLLYTTTLGLLSLFSLSSAQMRGIWVCSGELTNHDAIITCLDHCSDLGITDVFLQVRTAGDAAYDSATEPAPHKSTPTDLDVLETACSYGHKLGLRIHAWLNINYCAPGPGLPTSPLHIACRHPEWIACGRDGKSMTCYEKSQLRRMDSEGLYLSPGAEGLAEYFESVVSELLQKYPVDGIHMDFIRYANYRFGYGDKLTREFENEFFIDPAILAYEKGQPGGGGLEGGMELWKKVMNLRWMEMRADVLTELVRAIRHAQVTTRPDTELSAAVWFPITWAYSYVGQDWMRWLDEDLIDVAIPMAYSKSDQPLTGFLPQEKAYLESGRIAVGLGAWRLDSEGIKNKMEMLDGACGGWVLFDYQSLVGRPNVMQATQEFIQKNYPLVRSGNIQIPYGWQMGWANRRPLASQPTSKATVAGVVLPAATNTNHYWNEAVKLRDLAKKAWGDSEQLPGCKDLAETVLPWVDRCNRSLVSSTQPTEEDLRAYFHKNEADYLVKAKRSRSKPKRTKEEIEVAYQKNRDKVYRDLMLANIAKIIDDSTK